VGQQLLAKNGRGVRLTDAGRLLAEHAARILSQVELAQSDLEAQRGQVAGELRLSAFPTAARGLFPAALAELRAEHPALRVRSSELEPEAGVAGVVRGDLDLAVVLDWYNKPMPLPDGLVKASILDDPADVAMPAGHRLAGRDEVDLGDFADDEWITWAEGEFCHEWLMFTLRSQGVEPRIGHRAGETHTQLGLVAAGLGVCVAPLLGRRPMPEGVVTVPVRQRVRRHVYVVWRADADRRPSIRAAVDALRRAGAAVE
jgi:DNA-binding transcriptional LysR family regulator